jgi:hypothetical protein
MKQHSEGIKEVDKLVSKYCNSAEKYVYKLTSNVIESINHMRTKYAHKDTHHGSSYPGQGAQTILDFEEPQEWKLKALDQMHIPVTEQTENTLHYMAHVRADQSKKTKTQEHKMAQKKAKQKKKRRGSSGKRDTYKYGCGCKNSDCSNGKCMCVKDDRECGDNCECKDSEHCFNHGKQGMQNREKYKKKLEKKAMSTLRKRQHYEMMTEDSSDKGQVKKKKIITLVSDDENSEN